MPRPLTKHTRSGNRYSRPANIEALMDEALKLAWPTLRERLLVRDRHATGYLPSECLVHLIRQAHRDKNEAGRDQLLFILFSRCQSILATTLPDGRIPNAAYLRDEVLGRLGALFAEDSTDDSLNELDYFEVHFNKAFATLRADIVRAEVRAISRSTPLPEDNTIDRLPDVVLRSPATQENRLFLKQLMNTLTPDERKALILCKLLGYPEESDDPAKHSAATICGVTGRTIRNRLTRATSKLSKLGQISCRAFLPENICVKTSQGIEMRFDQNFNSLILSALKSSCLTKWTSMPIGEGISISFMLVPSIVFLS